MESKPKKKPISLFSGMNIKKKKQEDKKDKSKQPQTESLQPPTEQPESPKKQDNSKSKKKKPINFEKFKTGLFSKSSKKKKHNKKINETEEVTKQLEFDLDHDNVNEQKIEEIVSPINNLKNEQKVDQEEEVVNKKKKKKTMFAFIKKKKKKQQPDKEMDLSNNSFGSNVKEVSPNGGLENSMNDTLETLNKDLSQSHNEQVQVGDSAHQQQGDNQVESLGGKMNDDIGGDNQEVAPIQNGPLLTQETQQNSNHDQSNNDQSNSMSVILEGNDPVQTDNQTPNQVENCIETTNQSKENINEQEPINNPNVIPNEEYTNIDQLNNSENANKTMNNENTTNSTIEPQNQPSINLIKEEHSTTTPSIQPSTPKNQPLQLVDPSTDQSPKKTEEKKMLEELEEENTKIEKQVYKLKGDFRSKILREKNIKIWNEYFEFYLSEFTSLVNKEERKREKLAEIGNLMKKNSQIEEKMIVSLENEDMDEADRLQSELGCIEQKKKELEDELKQEDLKEENLHQESKY